MSNSLPTSEPSGDLARLASWWDEYGHDACPTISWVNDASSGRSPIEQVDRAVDGGATLIALTWPVAQTAARVAIAQATQASASDVVSVADTATDLDWMREVASIRDVRSGQDPDPQVAALAAALTRAAERSTPVLFDGVSAHAAALIAAELDASHQHWWLPAVTSSDAAIVVAQRALDVRPGLALQMNGQGTYGLRAALALLELVCPSHDH